MALEVEALEVAKLPVVPHSVVIVASVEVKVLMYPVTADKIPVIEVLEIVVDPKVDDPDTERLDVVMFEELKFVVDALISVALDVVKLVLEILVADRLVDVELVIVPLVELMLVSEIFPADKFVTVALVSVALDDVR